MEGVYGPLEASIDFAAAERDMWSLLTELFPIHRTLTGEGYRRSRRIIEEQLGLQFNVHGFPSGTQCFDWTIPPEWVIREAYVEEPRGRRVVDVKDSTLHVWQYSRPFRGRLSRAELLPHIYSLPEKPEVIPMHITYYRDQWGFCMRHRDVMALGPGPFDVVMDTELVQGQLEVYELYLPGEEAAEILFDSYLCHPSLAEDNLSGVVVAAVLMANLAAVQRRRFSYRLLLLPETIGPIAYLSRHLSSLKRKVVGGMHIVAVGADPMLRWKNSRRGPGWFDRVVAHVLRQSGRGYQIQPFYAHPGGNEKVYNAPGAALPIGSFTRSDQGAYLAYNTSADNLDFVKPQILCDSLRMLARIVDAAESDGLYQNTVTLVPFLTHHGLWPDTLVPGQMTEQDPQIEHKIYMALLHELDGETPLLDIADRLGVPIQALMPVVSLFEEKRLVRRLGVCAVPG